MFNGIAGHVPNLSLYDYCTEAEKEEVGRRLDQVFSDSFMKPQIWLANGYRVETPEGTQFYPLDEASIGDIKEEWPDVDSDDIEEIHGFFYRLSANGYMDRTDVCCAPTALEAADALIDLYGDE